jgi:hypothetical protein
VIGYYVHHQGRGHLHRASSIAAHLDTEVTGLSSLPRPDGWAGPWIELARDDADAFPSDVDAGGVLHWVPERCDGLRERMAAVSAFIARERPALMVVDVSVEVATLARLHGVPVVTTVLPGVRTDAPHRLVHGLARRIIAAWPAGVGDMLDGVPDDDPRLVHVGALSRFDDRIAAVPPARADRPRVALMLGSGGHDIEPGAVQVARDSTPDWDWTLLGTDDATWAADPWDVLRSADVVVAHAGQNAIAEIAAARVPAVLVAQHRPFGEQHAMAGALRRDGRWPAVALDAFPGSGWPALLDLARSLDGQRWAAWNDGGGAARAAAVIAQEIDR